VVEEQLEHVTERTCTDFLGSHFNNVIYAFIFSGVNLNRSVSSFLDNDSPYSLDTYHTTVMVCFIKCTYSIKSTDNRSISHTYVQ